MNPRDGPFGYDQLLKIKDLWEGNYAVCTQAEKHNVPTYIVGFVIGTAALCVAVISPLCGYLVSHLGCDLSALKCSLFCHKFFPCSFLNWE